jgi:archaeal flagellar protein FlaF
VAVAEIIGAAIGVLLLVIVAYLLVGGTLTAAETVMTAQKDMTLLNEARLKTSINVTDTPKVVGNVMTFSIQNNGEEAVSDLPHMDVFSFDPANGYVFYPYNANGVTSTWEHVRFENDVIHAKELDPGVTMVVQVTLPDSVAHIANVTPIQVQITTNNGVSAYSAVPVGG